MRGDSFHEFQLNDFIFLENLDSSNCKFSLESQKFSLSFSDISFLFAHHVISQLILLTLCVQSLKFCSRAYSYDFFFYKKKSNSSSASRYAFIYVLKFSKTKVFMPFFITIVILFVKLY